MGWLERQNANDIDIVDTFPVNPPPPPGTILSRWKEKKDYEHALSKQQFENVAQSIKALEAMRATVTLRVESSRMLTGHIERLNAIEREAKDPKTADKVRAYNEYMQHQLVNDFNKFIKIAVTSQAAILGTPLDVGYKERHN
jgi:hypothetical protein